MNPLFQQMNSQPDSLNGFMTRLNAFKNTFGGDPQQAIQQMLNSGRISQQQYNEAVRKANQIAQLLGKK